MYYKLQGVGNRVGLLMSEFECKFVDFPIASIISPAKSFLHACVNRPAACGPCSTSLLVEVLTLFEFLSSVSSTFLISGDIHVDILKGQFKICESY